MPLRTGDGVGIADVRRGDGTAISEIRRGDGAVLWRGLPDANLDHRYDASAQPGTDPLIDQAGSNDLAASGSPTRQAGDINGRDSINLDGSDDLYEGAPAPVGSGNEFTLAWVGRYLSTGSQYDYGITNGDPNATGWGFTTVSSNSEWQVVPIISGYGGATNYDSNLHTFIVTYDGATAILEIDGTIEASQSTADSLSPSGSLSIGGDWSDGTYDSLDIGEVLFYSAFKNSAERQQIRDYFGRWY